MEFLVKRYEKEIMRKGIPKYMAKEIAQTALEINNENPKLCIDYAIKLVYGYGLTK